MFRGESKRGQRRSSLRCVLLCLAVLCLIFGGRLVQSAVLSEQMIALVGGTLIDGNGGVPLKDAVVLIQGNKIVKVGSRNKVKYPKTAKVIDTTGKFILPGLIDMHIHYFDWMGELFLAHGVTTVKDVGNDLLWIETISSEAQQGKVRGPRIFYVGDGLDSPPPARETHVGVDTPQMAQRAVALLRSRGASAIKVREKLTPELLKAITEEAHKLGIPVTGHIRRTDAREAALAGIDGLEHVSGFLQALGLRPREFEPGQNELQTFIADLKAFSQIETVKADELIKLLASRQVALIPTMANWWRIASERREEFAREDAEYAKNPQLAYVPGDVRKQWASSSFYKLKNADDLAQVQAGYKKLQYILMQHYKAGGKVLAASDTFSSVPGLSLQRELMLLVDAGFTPMQAITMATRDNAQFLARGKETGTIVPGKLADIIVLSANPLEDIRDIERVEKVIKDGQEVDTNYHANYSIPTPRPAIKRPVWLEQQLQRSDKSKAGNGQTREAVKSDEPCSSAHAIGQEKEQNHAKASHLHHRCCSCCCRW